MINNKIFSDLKVVELASVLAGPSVGQFFAELGAEVIKVENPKTNGDVTRSWKSSGEKTDDISAYFSSVNWGKQSVALDYSKEKGLNLLYDLIRQADILILSFKPGDAEKLKITYEDVTKLNSQILYGSITGYGSADKRVGYDAVIQAESGFMSINGEVGGNPLKLPVALMDILAGHHLKEALLLAYINRLKTGKGQQVTVSLIDAAISSLANQATNWLVGGKEPVRSGSLHPNIAPYGEMFKTADNKKFVLAIGTDKQFQLLCNGLNISIEPKFASNQERVQNRSDLFKVLDAVIKTKNSSDLKELLNRDNIPGGTINSISEAIGQYDKMIIEHNKLKGVKTFASPIQNIKNSSHFLPPPHYGEHTIPILRDKIGLSDSQITDLKTNRVIG